MSEVIRFDTGIKKYEIVNENDERVAELVIDTNDTQLFDRFLELHDRVHEIQNECMEKFRNLGLDDKEAINTEDARKILRVNEEAVNQVIEETEKLFGKGLFHSVFAENYKLNPNFVPDISLVMNFYEQIMPIVQTVAQKRQKYSPSKKGKC